MQIDDILSKLDKKTRDRLVAASEISVDKIPTASLGLNTALGGGFGIGRQTLIWGNKSAGKSALGLQTVAQAQKQGITCAWVDAENSIDPPWCRKLGVDTDQLIVAPVKSIDDMTAVVCDLLKAEVGLCFVDSISAVLPSTYFEKNDEIKSGLEGTKQIGTASKELGIAVNKFNYMNRNTALVLISQARNQFNTYGASLKPMGGEAMKYYSSVIIKLWSSASEKEQITDDVYVGDKIFNVPVGRGVTATIEYNKIGPPNQVVQYDFYYNGEEVGVDQVGELITLGEKFDHIDKAGSWYMYNDVKLQGKHKLIKWFKEHPQEQEKLRTELGL